MWIGDVLDDRFVIERPIGSGGMATVFLATDRTSGQQVAVKAVDVTWDGASERFLREAAILAEISHPAVVRYVAHGETNGTPYLAMELLSGEDLETRLHRRPLSTAESLALARRVAEGLAAAHAKGIVHRDVKPSNLFLVDCDPRQVKVVDFGVARIHARAQTMTRTGSLLGTIGYMAPEQASGERNVDPRADVFSVGCVLFECLTGCPAFAGTHAITVMAKVLCEEPPRVSAAKPELAGAIDDLVARLLQKDRGSRPENGAVLAEDIAMVETNATPVLGTRTEDGRAATTRATQAVILGTPETTFVESGETITPAQAADEAARFRTLAAKHGARLTWLEGRSVVLELLDASIEDVSQRAVACAVELDRLDMGLAIAACAAPEAQVGALLDEAFSLLGAAGPLRRSGHVIVDARLAEVARRGFNVETKDGVACILSRSTRSDHGNPGETLDVVGDDRVHGRSPVLQDFLSRPNEERKLGAFYLMKQLGRGGFAPVWLASEVYDDVELRAAAVKLFAFAPTSSRAKNRYREHVIQEARALCQVEHPSIVRFYTLLVEDEAGILGLAMEYLGGLSLADRLRERERLGVAETVRVGVALASALDAAHRVGVIHRDVKPGNVMESPSGYKLIDFGIAMADELDAQLAVRREARNFLPANLPLEVVGTKISVLVGTARAEDRAAQPGVLASGTMGYIDPECIASGVRATAASDLYSLGALLFECLTGQVPAIAAATRPGLHAEVLDGRTPAPAVSTLAEDAPPRLAALVDRLLTADRSRRPATASAVLAELEAIRDELSPSRAGAAVTAVASSGKPNRRSIVLGGAVLAVAVGTVLAANTRSPAPKHADSIAQSVATVNLPSSMPATPNPPEPRPASGALALPPGSAAPVEEPKRPAGTPGAPPSVKMRTIPTKSPSSTMPKSTSSARKAAAATPPEVTSPFRHTRD